MDHKEIVAKLVEFGASYETAHKILGWFVEERQTIDRQGYCRGYNDGFAVAEAKFQPNEVLAG